MTAKALDIPRQHGRSHVGQILIDRGPDAFNEWNQGVVNYR